MKNECELMTLICPFVGGVCQRGSDEWYYLPNGIALPRRCYDYDSDTNELYIECLYIDFPKNGEKITFNN